MSGRMKTNVNGFKADELCKTLKTERETAHENFVTDCVNSIISHVYSYGGKYTVGIDHSPRCYGDRWYTYYFECGYTKDKYTKNYPEIFEKLKELGYDVSVTEVEMVVDYVGLPVVLTKERKLFNYVLIKERMYYDYSKRVEVKAMLKQFTISACCGNEE